MDHQPSSSTSPMPMPSIDKAAPSTQQLAPLRARPGSTYDPTHHRMDALAQDLSAQSLSERDDLEHPSLVLPMTHTPSHPPTLPRLEAMSPFLFQDEDGYGSSGDNVDDTANNLQPQEETPSPGAIEPDEPNLWNAQVDEGYGEGDDDYTWMQWPTTTEAEPYVGCRMKHLLHFRTSVEAALQCSTLVYKAPRMRKRKHRAGNTARHHHQSMDCGVRSSYQSLKRVRQD